MNKSMWGIALVSSLFAGTLIVRAAEQTTEPSKKGLHVEQPYSKISNLTDDEKAKIIDLHKKALEELKTIREKEDDDIRAVLTDDQKAELDKIIAEKREKTEAKYKEKHGHGAATEPAGG